MSNLIGYHFVDQVYSDAHVAKHMDHLRATKPAWINVLGGAQYNEALNFAKLVRRDIPETRVIFRHYKDGSDNGMHTRLTADEWWSKIGSLYVGSDLTILTDNESGGEDLTYYSDWHARAMTLAAQHGVSLAVCRMSTHNPPSKQWPQLDSLWRALDHFWSLHVYSPNIYFSDTNFDGIEHIFEGWRRCADIGVKSPNTVIGEFAYAYNLDPHKGYKSVKMSSADYVTRLIQRGAPLWAAGIAACIYSIGEWPVKEDTFGMDDDALKALRARIISQPPPIITPPPPAPIPLPTDPRWSGNNGKYIAQAKGTVRSLVRAEPNTSADEAGSLPPATPMKVRHIPWDALTEEERTYQFDDKLKLKWFVIVLPDGKIGYTREDVTSITPDAPPALPTLPPSDSPLWIATHVSTPTAAIRSQPSASEGRTLHTLTNVVNLSARRTDTLHDNWCGLEVDDAIGWVQRSTVTFNDAPDVPAPEPPLYIVMTREELDALIDKRVNGALKAFREELITALTVSEAKQQRKTA